MEIIRRRIEGGGERLWRLDDFQRPAPSAAAQALSRPTRQGILERLSKGVYYRSNRQQNFYRIVLGPERPHRT
jgi:hypothetical protein